ncbi:MAG: heme-binding domain-containing protein, partial [Ignavibacteriales bacterium]|nr:heme-binding domain-containing protein [Ignavibacteriales bacterium]
MKRYIKPILYAVLALAVVAQLFRPERTNPPVSAELDLRADPHVRKEVLSILQRACFDCH